MTSGGRSATAESSFDRQPAGVSPAKATALLAAALADDSDDPGPLRGPGTTGAGCKRAPGSPNIALTFPPTRIRQLDIYAGLSRKLSDSTKQYRPKIVVVSFDDGASCTLLQLRNTYLGLVADSKQPVSKMTIGIQRPPEEKSPSVENPTSPLAHAGGPGCPKVHPPLPPVTANTRSQSATAGRFVAVGSGVHDPAGRHGVSIHLGVRVIP